MGETLEQALFQNYQLVATAAGRHKWPVLKWEDLSNGDKKFWALLLELFGRELEEFGLAIVESDEAEDRDV